MMELRVDILLENSLNRRKIRLFDVFNRPCKRTNTISYTPMYVILHNASHEEDIFEKCPFLGIIPHCKNISSHTIPF